MLLARQPGYSTPTTPRSLGAFRLEPVYHSASKYLVLEAVLHFPAGCLETRSHGKQSAVSFPTSKP